MSVRTPQRHCEKSPADAPAWAWDVKGFKADFPIRSNSKNNSNSSNECNSSKNNKNSTTSINHDDRQALKSSFPGLKASLGVTALQVEKLQLNIRVNLGYLGLSCQPQTQGSV